MLSARDTMTNGSSCEGHAAGMQNFSEADGLRPAHARALSYSIVVSLAGLAIWFTPSLGAYRAMPVAPVVVVHPEMPATDYVSSPLYVIAPDGPIVDTVAVAGIIHESLFASLDNTAQEELPPSARH